MPLGLKKVLRVGFEDALAQVPEALNAEGFDVLSPALARGANLDDDLRVRKVAKNDAREARRVLAHFE